MGTRINKPNYIIHDEKAIEGGLGKGWARRYRVGWRQGERENLNDTWHSLIRKREGQFHHSRKIDRISFCSAGLARRTDIYISRQETNKLS